MLGFEAAERNGLEPVVVVVVVVAVVAVVGAGGIGQPERPVEATRTQPAEGELDRQRLITN